MNNMSKCIAIAAMTGFFLLLFPGSAAPSPIEPMINRLGQEGLLYTESAKTLGRGRLTIGLSGDASLDNSQVDFVLLDNTSPAINLNNVKSYQYSVMPKLGFGIMDFLDFSAMLPLYLDQVSRFDSLKPGNKSFGGFQGGIGDAEFDLKLQVPPRAGLRVLDMAYMAGVSVPTGDRAHGFFPRHSYYFLKDSTVLSAGGRVATGALSSCYSSGIVEALLKILLTFNCWERIDGTIPLQFHLNVGTRMLPARGFDQVVIFNAAAEYRPTSLFSLFTEVSSETRLGNLFNGFKINEDPLRLSPGFNINLPEGIFFSLFSEISLSSRAFLGWDASSALMNAKLQPDWRIGASLGWSGFLYKIEKGKGGKIGKNFDQDNDGMPDTLDQCPQFPEDKDGYQDEDGCPEYDNDGDHIPDSLDKCPDEPEDRDGFEDEEGCPDKDNDNDGIPDSLDRCPGIPEDRDGFEDSDGCPDYDNDLDGIPDSLDKCPDAAGVRENEGCFKPLEEQQTIKDVGWGRYILQGVEFKANSPDLMPESYQKLDDLFESLKAFPVVTIEISGFTDNAGNAALNKKLSLRRAETARAYLILRGIDPSRITVVGRGGEDPVTDNSTAEGRAFNRRIEIKRID
jgi:outer membrane protein OmpA-like peptidoglycan-associated protein